MAKKNLSTKSTGKISKPPVAARAASSTPVRNTVVPKTPAKREITREQIAVRAYEIYISGRGGSADDNWSRAERELRGA